MKILRFGAVLAMAAATTLGCGGDDDASTDAMSPLEIIGVYDDNFMGVQTITADDWNDAKIVGYDNDANIVYTQAPADDMFNPNKFGKTVYTEPKNGSFYFCTVEFALDTLADAKASKTTADDSDPDNTGCGGDFPWTKATKQ